MVRSHGGGPNLLLDVLVRMRDPLFLIFSAQTQIVLN